MPRQKQTRHISRPPEFEGYRPYGGPASPREAVELLFEEYEAVRLSDYEGLHHAEACLQMNVSRATFARIYESARQKIAAALAENREIRAVNRHSEADDDWYRCRQCSTRFPGNRRNGFGRQGCPDCDSDDTELVAGRFGGSGRGFGNGAGRGRGPGRGRNRQ